MIWRVEVKNKSKTYDSAGEAPPFHQKERDEGIKKDIADLGILNVESVEIAQVYIIEGDISQAQIRKVATSLLTDPVTQEFTIRDSPLIDKKTTGGGQFLVEVAYNHGVMDPVEESAKKGILDLGIKTVKSVKTAKKYIIKGTISESDLNTICEKLLYNRVIQHIVTSPDSYIAKLPPKYHFKLITVDLLNASDKELERISQKGQLFLSSIEMRQIKDYFKRLGRNPTDVELETLAQTWSEHCRHKTFRGEIEYKEEILNPKSGTLNKSKISKSKIKTKIINNLLKSTIMKVTRELKKPWCVSVFKDNSGVIRFDEDYNVCFKVETHNHPSAIEPYGGANTGLGGVIRDPLGTGLGAKPILNTDVFCFAEPDYPFADLPKGVLHPKRIMEGVVAGVRDYGNKMGIPTVNGAVLFDNRYLGNPLVYCGNVGLIPKNKSFKKVKSGDLVVLVGGRTGRDGIHGATFSSAELTAQSEQISAQAVQIGNPIEEKKMVDCILKARDSNLYDAITDCGGGGLSSAVGEMGAETGVAVALEKVPLKYEGLTYAEIWISEAQERMILAVPKGKIKALKEIFSKEDVEATVIGEFTNDKRLTLRYNGEIVCDLDMEFLHDGLPRIVRRAHWSKPKNKEPHFACPKDLTPYLLKILSSWNVCSKEWIIRQYDHEVQGGSVVKPLVGVNNDGPSDAAVVRPILNSKKAVTISNGINPKYGDIDSYWMAASCIDEALRQIIAVGGSLKEVALLDNFCWGDTDNPEQLGSLVRAAFGCYDIAKDYKTPFISGKDSLHNEYLVGKRRVSIPGTLLISAIGILDDVTKSITMDFKEPGSLIYIVGDTYDELGGSHYYALYGAIGNSVPKVNAKRGRRLMDRLSRAIHRGLVKACHDCSEGGIGVAVAEMAFAGNYGALVYLNEVPFRLSYSKRSSRRDDYILFSESNTRFIVEVAEKGHKEFERTMKGMPIGLIGRVQYRKDLIVFGSYNKTVVHVGLDRLKEAWQRPLRW